MRIRHRGTVIAAVLACAAGALPGTTTQASAAVAHTALTADSLAAASGAPESVVDDELNSTVVPYFEPTSLYGYETFGMTFRSSTDVFDTLADVRLGPVSGDLTPGTYTFNSGDFSGTRDQFFFQLLAPYGESGGMECNASDLAGTIVILQATHDSNHNLTSLAARYTVECDAVELTTPFHVKGEIRWQSNVDFVALDASTTHDFQRTAAGQTTPALPEVVTNRGTLPVTLGSVSAAGTDPSDFSLGTGCNGKTLQPGASCTIAITATPPGIDEVTATWSITDGTAQGKRVGTLSAAGMYAPTDVTAEGGQGQISLAFTAQDLVAEEDARYDPVQLFTLLRGTSPGNLAVLAINAGSGYQDMTAVPGVVYYYQFQMQARSGQYVTSPVSNGAVAWAIGGAGRYDTLAPYRVLDTRTGWGAPKHALGPGQSITIKLTEQDGIPATGVSAVVFNLTAVRGTASTYLTVYPAGQARPGVSAINVRAGEVRANLVTVPVGVGGAVTIYNRAGSVNVLADLAGYYTSASSTTPLLSDYGPGQLHSIVPLRVIDTRTSPAGALPAHYVLQQAISFPGPGYHIRSVVLNVTVIAPAAAGFVTASWTILSTPSTSTVNFAAHQTTPNLAIVPLGSCRITPACKQFYEFDIYNGSPGPVHLAVDVVGYYDDNWLPGGLRFKPVVPVRITDTRTGLGWPSALGPAGIASVTVPGTYTDALTAAVAMNVTGVGPTLPTFLTIWPSGAPKPVASNINVPAGQSLANAVMTGVGPGGTFSIYNGAGTTQVVADLVGTFEAWPSPPATAGALTPRIPTGPPLVRTVIGPSARTPV